VTSFANLALFLRSGRADAAFLSKVTTESHRC
jgi:hypothetical protein